MKSEHMVDRIRARPFEPFRIHLANGRSVNARHPDIILRSPGGRTVILFTDDDHLDIIDMGLVTSLRVLSDRERARRRKRSA